MKIEFRMWKAFVPVEIEQLSAGLNITSSHISDTLNRNPTVS